MLLEVGLIVAGIPIGYSLRNKPQVIRITNHALSFVIYALLFLIGLNLGGNDDLISRLADLGLQGVLIGALCSFGSIFVTWGIYNVIFKAGKP